MMRLFVADLLLGSPSFAGPAKSVSRAVAGSVVLFSTRPEGLSYKRTFSSLAELKSL